MNKVEIFRDNKFASAIEDFHIMHVKVDKVTRATTAPLENGASSPDYKVYEPIRISVDGYVDCSRSDKGFVALNTINSMIRNRAFQFYSVITRDAAYNNLMLLTCPHDEDNENLSMAYFHLDYLEAMIVQGESSKKSDSDNSNFTQKGYTAKVSSISSIVENRP